MNNHTAYLKSYLDGVFFGTHINFHWSRSVLHTYMCMCVIVYKQMADVTPNVTSSKYQENNISNIKSVIIFLSFFAIGKKMYV